MSLDTLIRALIDAEEALLAELARSYPVGTTVRYRLRAGVPEREGEVIGHIGGRHAKLRIRLAPNKRNNPEEWRYETTLPLAKVIRDETSTDCCPKG